MEAVDFQAASTASAFASILQFKYSEPSHDSHPPKWKRSTASTSLVAMYLALLLQSLLIVTNDNHSYLLIIESSPSTFYNLLLPLFLLVLRMISLSAARSCNFTASRRRDKLSCVTFFLLNMRTRNLTPLLSTASFSLCFFSLSLVADLRHFKQGFLHLSIRWTFHFVGEAVIQVRSSPPLPSLASKIYHIVIMSCNLFPSCSFSLHSLFFLFTFSF